MSNNFIMEFLEFTKKLLRIKKLDDDKKDYSINPFKKNKQVIFIWIEPKSK